jgi:hypothetical protein
MKLYLLALCLTWTALAQKIPHFLYITTPILELDSSLSGALDQNDGQNFKDGSRTEVLLANFKQGDVVELRLASEFDAFLSLYGPQKTVVATNDDGADTFESLLITEMPETGRYVIVVSGYSELDMGTYEITAKKLEVVDDTSLSLGSGINAFLSETADDVDVDGKSLDKFSLEINQAKTVTIQMISSLLDSYLKVIDENGQVIAENDDQIFEDDPQTEDTDESQGTSLNAEVIVTLEPGSYEIWATTASPNSYGFYQLFVTSE